MVDALGDGLDLLGDGQVVLVGERERISRAPGLIAVLAQGDHFVSQSQTALAALRPDLGQGHVHAQLAALGLHEVELGLRVGREGVDGHHAGQVVHVRDVLHVLQQVRQARLQRLEVLLGEVGLGHAAVVLQRAHRGDDHHRVGLKTGEAALDVEELLRAQIGAEAGLGHAVVAERHGHARGHDGVAAVGDVGERAAVHESRGALERLHEVRLQSVLQKRGHGALGLQIVGRDRRIIIGVAHHDAAQALLQVGDGGGQTEDGHNFRGHGDVEAVLAGHAVGFAAQAVHDVAQLAVVHVDHALPRDLAHVDVELVAVLDMRIKQRREQVVGRSDGVEVAGEVQVDVLHGNHLGVAAASRAALDAEHRPQRRLAQRHDHVLAAQRQRIGQAHRRGGLALSGRRGVNGGHQDELTRGVLLLAQQVVIDLRLVVSVQLEVLLVDAGNGGDLANGFRFGRLGNFNVGQHVGPFFLMSRRAGVPGSLIDRWRSADGRNRPAGQTLTLPF